MLGEEASEAQNQFYRRFRLSHARRTSRENNLKDIFLRVVDASDPLISNINMEKRMRMRKRLSIPQAVQDLLATLDVPHAEPDVEDEDYPDDSGLQESIINLDSVQLTADPELIE